MPTILQVLPALRTGGVERGAIDVALAVKKNGWISIVASFGGPLVKELERAGIKHIKLPLNSKNPWIIHKNANSIASAIYDNQIDIVHARSRAPAWSAYYAAKRMKVHYITTFHGTYNSQNFLKKAYNSIMIRGEHVISISSFISNHIKLNYKKSHCKIITIPRGIDLEYYNPIKVSHQRIVNLSKIWRLPDGVPVIMLPGRLTRWKGHKILIEALSMLGGYNFRCLFVGDVQNNIIYENELKALIKNKKLESVVHIVGHCKDMPAAYMLADVVVSPSTDPEAFGRVSVEAQAMGCVVIASNHGGSAETIRDEETGWLFYNKDSLSLSKIIKKVLDLSANEREILAKKSRSNVKLNYSLQAMQQSTINVYNEIFSI